MPKKKVLNTTPLDFVVIGSGQVVDKYWLRSHVDRSVNITDIVSLEPEKTFRQRNTNFVGRYYHSSSVDDTFAVLVKLGEKEGDLNIANVATSNIRLDLTQRILWNPCFGNTRVFVEKPFASNRQDLDTFADLIKEHSSRLHFSGKYSNGRANILYPCLPEGKFPTKIKGRLIEGAEYFRVIKKREEREGGHPYLNDGPELDLGFHLLDIIGIAFQKFGGIRRLRLKKVYDLCQRREEFEPNYGFGSEMEAYTLLGDTILLDLQAGKANTLNERFIEFYYKEAVYGQEYTVGDSIDPVYRVENGEKTTIAQHETGYNYYAQELSSAVFCKQTTGQQLASLSNIGISLDIRKRRLSLSHKDS